MSEFAMFYRVCVCVFSIFFIYICTINLQSLFFKYTWNNFLHTQVQQCLALAINCGHRDNDIIYNNVSIIALYDSSLSPRMKTKKETREPREIYYEIYVHV